MSARRAPSSAAAYVRFAPKSTMNWSRGPAPLRAKTSYAKTFWATAPPQRRSGPFQARKDRASHHPVLVALRQEAQLFGEMGDALAVACFGERVRDVGSPMAALRTVGVEYALQVHRHVAERIRFERIAECTRQLDADVRIFGERNGLINRRRDVLGNPVVTARRALAHVVDDER